MNAHMDRFLYENDCSGRGETWREYINWLSGGYGCWPDQLFQEGNQYINRIERTPQYILFSFSLINGCPPSSLLTRFKSSLRGLTSWNTTIKTLRNAVSTYGWVNSKSFCLSASSRHHLGLRNRFRWMISLNVRNGVVSGHSDIHHQWLGRVVFCL